MTAIEAVAKELHMRPNELINESLRAYLERRLANIESQLFTISRKYGVKDVFELDAKIKDGFVHEQEAYEDYFALDNLEAEREKIKMFIQEL